jgi:hypothetical protein
MAPAAAAAESEMRLRKNASVKVSDNERPRLTNSGHVTRHSPGNGTSTGGEDEDVKGLLGGSAAAFDMRLRARSAPC